MHAHAVGNYEVSSFKFLSEEVECYLKLSIDKAFNKLSLAQWEKWFSFSSKLNSFLSIRVSFDIH